MNRAEFMKELAYLLQDLDEDDKQDALQYYNDYLDEAGPDKEEAALQELGSPERIAAIIRADKNGSLKSGGEFTETGYQDERFQNPNCQVGQPCPDPQNGKDSRPSEKQPYTNRTLKFILWLILLLVLSPLILGIGSTLAGVVMGILGVFLALIIALAIVTITFLIVGLIVIPVGIIYIFIEPLNGILASGIGLTMLGMGLLLAALSLLFYGKLIPFLFCRIVDFFNRLIHKGRTQP